MVNFSPVIRLVPLRVVLAPALAALLVACGGGGGSGDSGLPGPDPDPGNPGPETPGPGIPAIALEALPEARFTSPEAVVVLSPLSLYPETIGPTQAVTAALGLTWDNLDQLTGEVCELGGERTVEQRGLQDLASPYTGELFNVAAVTDDHCMEGASSDDGRSFRSVTDGMRILGYRSSQTVDDLVGYEESGLSLEAPFSVRQSIDGETVFAWSRRWIGHVFLEPGSDADAGIMPGTETGKTRFHYIGHRFVRGGGGVTGAGIQFGGSDAPTERFEFTYSASTDAPATAARTESFSGVYGFSYLLLGDREPPASCPGGRFRVATQVPLDIVALPEGESGLRGRGEEIMSGSLVLEDGAGSHAVVDFDGTVDTVSVTLDGGTTESFTYEEIDQLIADLCTPD